MKHIVIPLEIFTRREFLIFFLPLCLSLTAIKCKLTVKEPDPQLQLPPETQTGANTFGCLVNGKVWVANCCTCPGPLGGLSFYYDSGLFHLVACRKETSNIGTYEQALVFNANQLFSPNIYDLKDPNKFVVGFLDDVRACEYISPLLMDGKIEFTKVDINTSGGIIAGKFNFTLATKNCDTIRITEGRFDISLN